MTGRGLEVEVDVGDVNPVGAVDALHLRPWEPDAVDRAKERPLEPALDAGHPEGGLDGARPRSTGPSEVVQAPTEERRLGQAQPLRAVDGVAELAWGSTTPASSMIVLVAEVTGRPSTRDRSIWSNEEVDVTLPMAVPLAQLSGYEELDRGPPRTRPAHGALLRIVP